MGDIGLLTCVRQSGSSWCRDATGGAAYGMQYADSVRQAREATSLSDDAMLLFGLAGVRVERVVLLPGGVREVPVQTAGEGGSGCSSCGVLSSSMKGRVVTTPRDIPCWTGSVAMVWQAPVAGGDRGGCRGCEPREQRGGRRVRGVVTDSACRVRRGCRSWLGPPAPVLGIDETRRGRQRWEQGSATEKWCWWIAGTRDSSTAPRPCSARCWAGLAPTSPGWLQAQGGAFCERVGFVVIDPCAAYRRGRSGTTACAGRGEPLPPGVRRDRLSQGA